MSVVLFFFTQCQEPKQTGYGVVLASNWMTGSTGTTGSHRFWSSRGLFWETAYTDWQWQQLTSFPYFSVRTEISLPLLPFSSSPPPPPSHSIFSFSSPSNFPYPLFCLYSDLFTGTPSFIIELLWPLTCHLLGPIWAGWAGWTLGVLEVGRDAAPPPPAPALLTRRPASWCFRTTGDKWVEVTPLLSNPYGVT